MSNSSSDDDLKSENKQRANKLLSLLQSLIGVGTYLLVMRLVVKVDGLEAVGLWALTVGIVSFVRLMDLSGASGLARMVAIEAGYPLRQVYYIDTLTIVIGGLYTLLCLVAYIPLEYVLRTIVEVDQFDLAGSLIIWALVALPFNVVGIAQLSAIDGIGRADVRSLINIFGFALFGMISFFLAESHGIIGLAYAQMVQFIISLLLARAYLTTNLAPLGFIPRRVSVMAARDCLGYGLRLQFASLPMAFFDPMTRVLLGRWTTIEYLGIYDLGYKLAGHTRTIIQAYFNPMIPELANLWTQSQDNARAFFQYRNLRAVRLVAFAYIVLILLSPVAGMFLLGEVMPEFIFVTVTLSLAWGLGSLALPTNLFARAAGLLRWSIVGQSLILISGPLLLSFFLSHFGQSSASVAVGLSILVGSLVTYIGDVHALKIGSLRSNIRCVSALDISILVLFVSLGAGGMAWSLVS